MIRLFCGYDDREAIGFHVFVSSVIRHSSIPVMFCPVQDMEETDGSNAFTYARFRVAEMCGFDGWAIFADACDMLAIGDLADLWAQRDDGFAVQVVKHSYRTQHKVKYVGTSMECPNVDYSRKNWSSLMLINCSAPEWRFAHTSGREAHQFAGFDDSRIGVISREWNVLVDEGQPVEGAKLMHWTAGIPAFKHYASAPGADLWRSELAFSSSNG